MLRIERQVIKSGAVGEDVVIAEARKRQFRTGSAAQNMFFYDGSNLLGIDVDVGYFILARFKYFDDRLVHAHADTADFFQSNMFKPAFSELLAKRFEHFIRTGGDAACCHADDHPHVGRFFKFCFPFIAKAE